MPTASDNLRKGFDPVELARMFPDEASATRWFEELRWPNGRLCIHCGGTRTSEVPNRKPMPYWCTDCRSYFSIRTGSMLENSRLSLRQWAFAVHLFATDPKGVTDETLCADIGITRRTGEIMLERLRMAGARTGIRELAVR